ncbi:MAG: NDP-sugar synthase [Chloroflexi bacterium]|nr:NDP-sugar synthase [Chloroflexota bacterium]
MQAVVLAGGEGTRLRPLTCTTPKSMVPVLNRPYLERLLRRLTEVDVRDVILTLSYLPEKIQEYFGNGNDFGVSLSYGMETTPLGTAGAVKNVEEQITGTFLVFNGDIFTDLDLRAALDFHCQHGAKATIVLTPVEDPSPFGVVETAPDGRVLRFLEKPQPDQVTTLWINAGTYILEPEVLEYIPKGEHYMFERGLFPRLLEERVPVYSMRSRSYWMDVGNPRNYLKLHRELLLGSVKLDMDGVMLRDNLWVGEGCNIDPSAEIRAPVLIGPGCSVGPRARLLGPLVLGPGCQIGEEASLSGSILWSGVEVRRGASLHGCILGNGVRICQGSSVGEGCVLGDDIIVGDGNRLERGIAIWPGAVLDPNIISFL